MTSSGMKRGLAATAVSALAVTGLPFLTVSASATPIADVIDDAHGANYVSLFSQSQVGAAVSTKADGTNNTVSLVAGGGSKVTAVQFQWKLASEDATAYRDINGAVNRNADGVFTTEWEGANATSPIDIRVVASTGAMDVAPGLIVEKATAAGTRTVELATEGSLGVFQEPYEKAQHLVIAHGTTSDKNTDVDVVDMLHSGAFKAVQSDDKGKFATALNIAGYDYSADDSANQIVLGAFAGNTDDAEASSLYIQQINSVSAAAKNTKIPAGSTTPVTVTVTDQFGKPIAGARVGYTTPSATAGQPDVNNAVAERTDALGQVVVDLGKGAYTFYADKTDKVGLDAGDAKAGKVTIDDYEQRNTSLAASSVKERSVFDADEIGADTFNATLLDQEGNGVANQPVDYRWTYKAPNSTTTPTPGSWQAAQVTDAKGKTNLTFPADRKAGQYTLEVRRPATNGTGFMSAAPVTYKVGESEIVLEDGDKARGGINTTREFTGNLSLTDGTALAGREVTVSYARGVLGDVKFSASQPQGVKRDSDDQVTATTDADGNFTVKLTDSTYIPPFGEPAAETGVLTATAAALKGAGDAANADASDSVEVAWEKAPTPASIEVAVTELIDDLKTPGRPVALDVTVKDKDKNVLSDFPVEVTVDKGFLSPDAADAAGLTPASTPKAGDEYGFWKQLGASKVISTGDAGQAAGIVAAMEDDADFDDDGVAIMTVTMKAGDVVKTQTVRFESESPLNLGELRIEPVEGAAAGDVSTDETVAYNVFLEDQFGNLVQDEVRVFDNTPVADFRTDGFAGEALSDLVNDGASIEAFSRGAASQILEGRYFGESHLYKADGTVEDDSVTVKGFSDPINWVVVEEPVDPEPEPKSQIEAGLEVANKANGKDVVFVFADDEAAGAKVKLFKVRANGTKKKLDVQTLNAAGNARFVVADKNNLKPTTYVARVAGTPLTFGDWTAERNAR